MPGVEGATGEFRIPDEEGGPSALITCGDSFVLFAFSNQTPLNDKVRSVDLGIRKTFGDIGATVAEFLQVKPGKIGKSFLPEIMK